MSELPRHLSPEQVERYAREADTLVQFTRAARVGRGDVKRILNDYGLRDEVDTCTSALLES